MTPSSATSTAALVLVLLSACQAPDVDLGKLQLRAWQPLVLSSGDGDLLDDAARVDVTVHVDDGEETFALAEDRSAPQLAADPAGSDVRVSLRTFGTTLPDALGRSATARLEPGGGEVVVTALLAPPDVEHMLADTLPDARVGMATCSSTSGRVWAAGGLLGGVLAAGSFLVDPESRSVEEGPSLVERRTHAACVADESGGVYLAGGCDADGAALGGLVWSEGGNLGPPFVDVAALPGAGCHTRLTRTDDGDILALTGSQLVRYSPVEDESLSLASVPRRGGVLLAFPGEGTRVLVSGGFSDEALLVPVSGSVVYVIEDDSVVETLPLTRAFAAATTDGDDVIVSDGAHVSRLAPDGSTDPLYEGVIPGAFAPSQIASLHDGRFALLSGDGASLLIVGGDSPKTLPLAPPRPSGSLFSDPGGALLVLGGEVAGISVLVVE